MDYNKEIRQVLKINGLSLRKFSEKLGSSYQYVRFIMKPSEIRTVLWQKAFMVGYELGKLSKEDKV